MQKHIHIIYNYAWALCIKFCAFYKTLFSFYICFSFRAQSTYRNLPCITSYLYHMLFYNQQQHKYIHTLKAHYTEMPKSKKKNLKGAKDGKTLQHSVFSSFSSFIGRSAMILPQHVGHIFFVHNGKTYNSVSISPKMLGHKFGEFACTRKKPLHKKKK